MSSAMRHDDIHQGLCHIMRYILVNFVKIYSDFEGIYHILMFMKRNVGFQCSLIVM